MNTPLPVELHSEWADERDISSVSAGSRYKAKWSCEQGHTWTAAVYSRSAGRGCPVCAGRQLLVGYNDLATTDPETEDFWADERPITEFSRGSNVSVQWKCVAGHSYMASPASIVRGRGCPFCAGKQVQLGSNDLGSLYPALAQEWDDEDDISQFTAHSGRKVSWKCEMGHSWKATVASRALGRGCPVCVNRRVIAGTNDLATTHPQLVAEWADARSITTVSHGSAYEASWKCAHGHIWNASVNNRSSGRGCPVCTNRRVDFGANHFLLFAPELATEWADEADPNSFSPGSGYRAKWKCSKNHSWESTVKDRVRGTRCPVCVSKSYVSLLEEEVSEYIRSIYNGRIVTSERRLPGLSEVDIYLPDIQIGVEVNGVYYHSEACKSPDYHFRKQEAASRIGLRLIEVWEDSWRYRRAVVERMLAHKLGVSTEERVPARKTEPEFLGLHEARDFLEQNHIQGWASGSYYLGLRASNTTLVAVMSLKKAGAGVLRLERYATSCVVAGGQSRLLRYAEASISGWERILTFADASVSDGKLYESSGWERDARLPPDYSYLAKGKRRHKFGYRLERFRTDPELSYREGATEKELAAENGLLRVWDSGKTRYVYHRSSTLLR